MLIVVTVLSLIIGQTSTALLIGFLVALNIWMATSQALKARASVDALEELQVPAARVIRAGRVESIDSLELVPGDVVMVEAGDNQCTDVDCNIVSKERIGRRACGSSFALE